MHDLVRTMVRKYAEAAGVARPPRVFTNAKSFERHMARRGGLTRKERAFLRQGYALCVHRSTTRCELYFNLPRHENEAELRNSAAHEVVHARWRSLPHNALFRQRVNALLAGETCGPRGSRLPDEFRLEA